MDATLTLIFCRETGDLCYTNVTHYLYAFYKLIFHASRASYNVAIYRRKVQVLKTWPKIAPEVLVIAFTYVKAVLRSF